jgi:hypothetical protein
MGFSNDNIAGLTLIAKLTPFGRQQLLAGSTNLITHFSVGDSDANYFAELPLGLGEVPESSGSVGVNDTTNNSIIGGVSFRSNVLVDKLGNVRKLINVNSLGVVSNKVENGFTSHTITALTQTIVDRTDFATDSLVNLFYSFGLPITESDKALFTAVTSTNGGFSDTAFSGINNDSIIVIGVDDDIYGESLDGKTIEVVLQTTATTFTLYSTFQNTLTPLTTQDANLKESSVESRRLGNNIAFLFSDGINTPNGDVSKSWATGYNTVKPFTRNKKELFNYTTTSSQNLTADTVVGIAYLDKGFIVVTDPTIVSDFDPLSSGGTATTVSFQNVSTRVSQNFVCVLDYGEFTSSSNPTYANGDSIRISEIGLHDSAGNLIAMAKTNKHIEKNANEFMAFSIQLDV